MSAAQNNIRLKKVNTPSLADNKPLDYGFFSNPYVVKFTTLPGLPSPAKLRAMTRFKY